MVHSGSKVAQLPAFRCTGAAVTLVVPNVRSNIVRHQPGRDPVEAIVLPEFQDMDHRMVKTIATILLHQMAVEQIHDIGDLHPVRCPGVPAAGKPTFPHEIFEEFLRFDAVSSTCR